MMRDVLFRPAGLSLRKIQFGTCACWKCVMIYTGFADEMESKY